MSAVVAGPLDTVGGLPTHPLVVHLAVVMLPLSVIALIVLIAVPRWRAAYGWPTIVALMVGAGAGILAAQTGEALAEQIGLPQDHARWGDLLEKVGLLTFLVGAVWFWLQRRNAARTPGARPVLGPPAQAVAALASVALGLLTLGLTVVVGHSGATAVWNGRLPEPTQAATAATSPSPSAEASLQPGASVPSPTPTATSSAITLADVATHASSADCWAAVDGKVYDLTSWITQHPGGQNAILALCGTDASRAFHAQHGSERRPAQELAGFEIGVLG